jgi:hypothetical protein
VEDFEDVADPDNIDSAFIAKDLSEKFVIYNLSKDEKKPIGFIYSNSHLNLQQFRSRLLVEEIFPQDVLFKFVNRNGDLIETDEAS